MILGSAGAGKSTLAKEIGEITGIEVLHLDTLFWKPGWVQESKEQFEKKISNYAKRDSWIMDGNYRGTMDIRIEYADTIIFIDVPRLICLYRVIRRRFKYRGKTRPDLTVGCNEKIDMEFLKWIWGFPKRNRSEIITKMKLNSETKEIFFLKDQKDKENLIESIKCNFSE